MIKKTLFASSLLLSALIMAGCTVSNQPPTCEQLKRQWLYNNTNANLEAGWITSSQQQDLQQKMQAACGTSAAS